MARFAPRCLAASTAAGVLAAAGLVTAAPAGAASPPPPSSVRVHSGSTGTYLTWSASGASRFQVQQATSARFSGGTRIYGLRDGRDRQFTPYSLHTGTTYYWRIRAFAGSNASGWSAAVHAVVRSHEQPIRAEQFNVSDEDGEREAGGTVLAWPQRRGAVAGIVRQAHPDVLAVEEAYAWVGAPRGERVVDDLVGLLGSPYRLARTEVPPNEPHYFRTGTYVVYDASKYVTAASGGHWSLGNGAWQVYQLLRNRTSGATFLFIAVHLVATAGSSGDKLRQTEMQKVISNATSYASSHGNVAVVYAGDVNSHDAHNHAFDGPGNAARVAHVADAFKTAQSRVNAKYNSANDYARTPPAFGRSLDRIFGGPGVGIGGWREWLNLSHGRWVGVIPSDHNAVTADLRIPF